MDRPGLGLAPERLGGSGECLAGRQKITTLPCRAVWLHSGSDAWEAAVRPPTCSAVVSARTVGVLYGSLPDAWEVTTGRMESNVWRAVAGFQPVSAAASLRQPCQRVPFADPANGDQSGKLGLAGPGLALFPRINGQARHADQLAVIGG